MRQFLWGILFGALAIYYYTYYGYEFVHAKQKLDAWRSHAVSESSGYAAGRKK